MTPEAVKTEIKLALCLALAIVVFAAGWTAADWRAGVEIARLKQARAEENEQAVTEINRELTKAQKRGDDLAALLAASELKQLTLEEEQKSEIRRLTTGKPCLSHAAVSVLNRPDLPARAKPGAVAEAAGQPVSTDAAFASDTDVSLWIAGAQRAYNTCRGRLRAIENFYDREEVTVTDVFDRAQDREAEIRADALSDMARAAQAAAAQPSAEICIECDEPIPAGRREKVPGVQTCIECQTHLEGLKKRGLLK